MFDEKYISSKQAAKITGYSSDYVGQLCRLGKVRSKRIGRDWMISESSILNYKNGGYALARQIFSISESRLDEWDKALFEKERDFDLGFLIKPLVFTAVSMAVITGLVLNLGAVSEFAYQVKNNVAEINLPKIPEITFPKLPLSLAALPSLPFTWEDSKLAVLDLKNRFLENLFLWKDYLASLGGDIKIIAQDFLSLKPSSTLGVESQKTPSVFQGEGSKIITFGKDNSSPAPSTPPLNVRGGEEGGVKEIKTIVERVLSGITQTDLDQRLSSLNQTILSQVQLSLSALEKRLPSNQVQNPVVFLTTQIPGPQQAGGGSPPQTGSGVSASFGDFSSGISTGGNLTASGNITLGNEAKSASITSSTWKITSAGGASGFTSLSADSLSATSLNVSSLTTGTITGDPTFSGNILFSNNSTTTILSSAINAFSFATSTTAVPFLSFDTKNYRIGIGTTTPSETFSVNGNGIFSGSLNVGGFLIANSSSFTVSATTTASNQLAATAAHASPHTFGTWAIDTAGSNVTNSSLLVNPASSVADGNLFGIAVAGGVNVLVDAEG